MLLTIAFLCFALQILAWIVLPSSAPETVPVRAEAEPVADMLPA